MPANHGAGLSSPASTRPSAALLERIAARAATTSTDTAGRELLVRAVRRVAYAEGAKETEARLVDVAAAAAAWAAVLTGDTEVDPADLAARF